MKKELRITKNYNDFKISHLKKYDTQTIVYVLGIRSSVKRKKTNFYWMDSQRFKFTEYMVSYVGAVEFNQCDLPLSSKRFTPENISYMFGINIYFFQMRSIAPPKHFPHIKSRINYL